MHDLAPCGVGPEELDQRRRAIGAPLLVTGLVLLPITTLDSSRRMAAGFAATGGVSVVIGIPLLLIGLPLLLISLGRRRWRA